MKGVPQVLDFEVLNEDPNAEGFQALARFRAQVGAVRVKGCVLVRRHRPEKRSHGLIVRFPSGVTLASAARRNLKNVAKERYYSELFAQTDTSAPAVFGDELDASGF
ncbi:hypothetical protein PARPLA_01192 [Rhodobacteraceae bacterium THAF1]|uniref:hypothetical protein n=1 Tax=Palleronia sp. THAF1 TaxID=2587842 RepID=UPI000F400F24|nr:hypothetical protein [Palleronia sp. THAF1]QFU07285.1 hypothetical protein FIU81_01220 [Palleronia sp. THAF1]VDC20803.1 hypothetical protein PARPLA_01192 [Rhodobacteraceae bacterium THAF1]